MGANPGIRLQFPLRYTDGSIRDADGRSVAMLDVPALRRAGLTAADIETLGRALAAGSVVAEGGQE